ncbi:MAG: tryptophan halogenase family protein [Xanthomonadaceae bacterium]|nr:tryptophan halogenase family protein [Xanthomonadaceae bacterium]
MSDNRIRTLVIVGGGTAGWMAAAVLAKAFGPGLSIRLVESEEIGIVGVGEATIPQIRLINQFLGLDEDEFLRASKGTFKLGIQFNDWTRLGDSYLHAFGETGLPVGVLGFHHYWLRGLHAGRPERYWDYSLNTRAALANRFGRLETLGQTPLAGIRYAFHFDAGLYARHLRSHAEQRGVQRTEGRIVSVEQRDPDGFIDAVVLDGGERVAGDFFLDCSGFRGLLIEGALKAGYEPWSHWLPCDRAMAVPSARVEPMRSYTQANARVAGWQWRIPLQHRTGNGHVYCSQYISDDEAAAILLANLEGEALDEPRPLRFVTGMRKRFWHRNCLAIGLSSGFMEPLESTSIHLIQSAIGRFMQLFPERDVDPALSEEYNRQTRFEYERIRDFLILHYKANQRTDSAFWRDCAAMPVPDSLSAKIELFRTGGRVHRDAEELFTEGSWVQVFLGQGIIPERHHPLADSLEMARLEEFMASIRGAVERAADSLPQHAEFLAEHCA